MSDSDIERLVEGYSAIMAPSSGGIPHEIHRVIVNAFRNGLEAARAASTAGVDTVYNTIMQAGTEDERKHGEGVEWFQILRNNRYGNN